MTYSGNNKRGGIRIPEHAHPLVVEFIGEMNEQGATFREIGKEAGVGVDTMRFWPTRHVPRLDTFDAALNCLGLELTIRPTKNSATQIIKEIIRANRVTIEDIKGPSRAPALFKLRREIAQRLAAECKMTTGQIGRRIGRSGWTVRYYLDAAFRKRRMVERTARAKQYPRVNHGQVVSPVASDAKSGVLAGA